MNWLIALGIMILISYVCIIPTHMLGIDDPTFSDLWDEIVYTQVLLCVVIIIQIKGLLDEWK